MSKNKSFRIIILLILVVIPFIITGCGINSESSKNYGIITDGDEETKITAEELKQINEDNSARFLKKYSGKEIKVKDKVIAIDADEDMACLYLENGWVFEYDYDIYNKNDYQSFLDFISDLDKGDTVKLTGEIFDTDGYCNGGIGGDTDYDVEVTITSSSIMEKLN